MFIERLPAELENAEALIARRAKAADVKERWRSLYQDAYRFAMPTRETFSWTVEGQEKQRQLYDSTLMESTYLAANTTCALLFPSWTRWAELAPGNAIREEDVTEDMTAGLQSATRTLFGFLNNSNFGTVINEAALDLMVGTCAISIEEGDADSPFRFSSIPLSSIEIEEGPDGSVETDWMARKVKARNLLRLYPGLTMFDLSGTTRDAIVNTPDAEIDVIQGTVYHPGTKKYYGVVVEVASKMIIWRYDYGVSCPQIVARATKVAGETYGRGRVLLALPNAKSLDKMMEFTLRQAAMQLAPPMTGVSDGVLNPYTATLMPNTVIPVASNDSGAPSLRPLEIGGNFNITEALLDAYRQSVRRIMLGPEPSEGAVRSATENNISDRNRLWAMNGEFSRIQSELLAKILSRCVFILQKKGLIPNFRVDGRMVQVKYTSPFNKSQNAEDVMAMQETIMIAGALGPENMALNLKIEEIPAWIGRMKGIPERLIRSSDEREEFANKAAQAAQAVGEAEQETQAEGMS